jgi:hypothetical protein
MPADYCMIMTLAVDGLAQGHHLPKLVDAPGSRLDLLRASDPIEPAWVSRRLLTLETRMEHEQEAHIEAVSA